MTNRNSEIKKAIKDAKINMWQVAEKLGQNDGNFSRHMRKNLSNEQKEQLYRIIEELKLENKKEMSIMTKLNIEVENNVATVTKIGEKEEVLKMFGRLARELCYEYGCNLGELISNMQDAPRMFKDGE